MDVHITHTSTSEITVDKLRQTFATFGLPRMIVTDNGPSFTSKQFQSFMTENGTSQKKFSVSSSYEWLGREGRSFKHSNVVE